MDLQSDITLFTGNKMPVIGLGTWRLIHNTADAIENALRLGYRMIDTSGDYGTQPGIAEGLKRSGRPRESYYIVTKVEEYEDAYESTKNNLRQLKLEYADLMLIHRPPEKGAGVELWEGLIRAKKEGLTRDIGVSNYSRGLIDKLIDATREVPAVNQIEWTPFGHSMDMLDYAKSKHMVIQAYSPLTRTSHLDDTDVRKIAEKHGKTPAQVLIRWNLQLGTVPLPKANKPEHQAENIDVFDFELSNEEMDKLTKLNREFSAVGELPYL